MLSWGLRAPGGSAEIKKGCRVDGKEAGVSSGPGQLSPEFSCAGVPIPADCVAKVKESVPAVTATALYAYTWPFHAHAIPQGKGASRLVPKIRLRKLEPEVAEFGKLAVPECFCFCFCLAVPSLSGGTWDLRSSVQHGCGSA